MTDRDYTFRPILSSDELGLIRKHLITRSDSALKLFMLNPIEINPSQFKRVQAAFEEIGIAMSRGLARVMHGLGEAMRAFNDYSGTLVRVVPPPAPEPIMSMSPLAAFETSVRSKRDAIFREMFGVTEEHDVWGNKIVEEPPTESTLSGGEIPVVVSKPGLPSGGLITLSAGREFSVGTVLMVSGGAGGGTASGGNFVGVCSGDAARGGSMIASGTASLSASNPSTPVNVMTKCIPVILKNEG